MDIHYPYMEPTTFTVILVENRLQIENRLQQFVLQFDKHDHLNCKKFEVIEKDQIEINM